MSLLAIELNDAGLRAARGGALLPVDGEHLASPGFVWLNGKSIVTGEAAARQVCLEPTAVDSRHWDQLDTDGAPNHAEIACAHLKELMRGLHDPGDELVAAVPPFYETRQLGIIVGIARELGVPLRALVAGPITLESDEALHGTVLVVEVSMHRSVVSTVEIAERVRLGATRVCPEVSLHALRRHWIKALGEEFVRMTRFDPLHDAATEQLLHDRLGDLLESLSEGTSALLEMPAGRAVHRVTVTDQMLSSAGHSLSFRLCNEVQAASSSPVAILLTHEAARVPGLKRTLEHQFTCPVRCAAPGAAALGLTRLWPDRFEQPESDGVAYHTWRHTGRHAGTAAG